MSAGKTLHSKQIHIKIALFCTQTPLDVDGAVCGVACCPIQVPHSPAALCRREHLLPWRNLAPQGADWPAFQWRISLRLSVPVYFSFLRLLISFVLLCEQFVGWCWLNCFLLPAICGDTHLLRNWDVILHLPRRSSWHMSWVSSDRLFTRLFNWTLILNPFVFMMRAFNLGEDKSGIFCGHSNRSLFNGYANNYLLANRRSSLCSSVPARAVRIRSR